jgi:Spy/CpxP family protein refolding chaperone
MSPKSLLALSLVSAGIFFSQASLRADDSQTPPAPPADNPPPADGQPTPPPHRRMHRPLSLAELTAKLGLTADQQKIIGPILANSRSQAKELRDDDSLSREDKHAKMKEIEAAAKEQIRAALTPEQQKIFDALPSHEGRPPPQGPDSPTPTPPPTT